MWFASSKISLKKTDDALYSKNADLGAWFVATQRYGDIVVECNLRRFFGRRTEILHLENIMYV